MDKISSFFKDTMKEISKTIKGKTDVAGCISEYKEEKP